MKKEKKEMIVPYRESLITKILKSSMELDGHIIMIANLSPNNNHFEENISTLEWASKASKIQMRSKISTNNNVNDLYKTIDLLKSELEYKDKIIREKDIKISQLKFENSQLRSYSSSRLSLNNSESTNFKSSNLPLFNVGNLLNSQSSEDKKIYFENDQDVYHSFKDENHKESIQSLQSGNTGDLSTTSNNLTNNSNLKLDDITLKTNKNIMNTNNNYINNNSINTNVTNKISS